MAHPLLPKLNAMLAAVGQQKSVDSAGKVTYINVSIFKDEDLETFLELATTATSTVLKTTFDVTVTNPDLVVEYAAYLALTSRSLIEKGREYAIQDDGMILDPPRVSDHMMNAAHSLIDSWFKKVHLIRG